MSTPSPDAAYFATNLFPQSVSDFTERRFYRTVAVPLLCTRGLLARHRAFPDEFGLPLTETSPAFHVLRDGVFPEQQEEEYRYFVAWRDGRYGHLPPGNEPLIPLEYWAVTRQQWRRRRPVKYRNHRDRLTLYDVYRCHIKLLPPSMQAMQAMQARLSYNFDHACAGRTYL
jgi:hypothetical protein